MKPTLEQLPIIAATLTVVKIDKGDTPQMIATEYSRVLEALAARFYPATASVKKS